ncbi:MAG: aspartate aminotransferase family protein [Anaerolineae bacterium]
MFIGQQPKTAILEDYARYVNPGRVSVFKMVGLDFIPGRREGVWLWDVDGSRRLLNCRCSGGVFNLGHRPPRVVQALKAALDEIDVGDHMLLDEMRAALGKRLAALTPGDIQYSTFSPGGAEAIDVAIKLARAYTGRPGIISMHKGYHGHTGFALATGEETFRGKFGPMPPGFTKVPFGDADALASALNEQTAAVIMETIPATGGILIPPDDYYPRVRQLCDQWGALLILDEVQAGLGRTGRMWAIDEWGVVPDILVIGKGLSGGVYPMSATCHRPHLDRFFQEHPFIHLSSFGGAALGCVAALAMFDQITAPGFMEHVQAMGERFEAGFRDLQTRHAIIATWRRRGLMMGLELVDAHMGMALSPLMAQNGVLAVFADHRPSTLQLMPPLIIQPDEVDFVLEALDRALAFLEAHPEMLEMVAALSGRLGM